MPCGPDQQDDDEHRQRADVLQLRGHHERGDLDQQADDEAADQGAPDAVPRPPSITAANISSRILKPELVVEALGQPSRTPGQAGQGRTADPDHADDAVHVDA